MNMTYFKNLSKWPVHIPTAGQFTRATRGFAIHSCAGTKTISDHITFTNENVDFYRCDCLNGGGCAAPILKADPQIFNKFLCHSRGAV